MPIRVAINGFGRIGRAFFRSAYDCAEIEIVAVNDLVDVPTLVHFLKYDSVHGSFNQEIALGEGGFCLAGKEVRVLRQPDARKLPWRELGVDIVIESSGRYTDRVQSERTCRPERAM